MLLPITLYRGENHPTTQGTNCAGVVIVNPFLDYPSAVWAQQAYESRVKINPISLIRRKDKDFNRHLKLMSHEINVQASVVVYSNIVHDFDEVDYRHNEVLNLIRECKDLFDGYEPREIYRSMVGKKADAQVWVSNHIEDIKAKKLT